MEGYLFIFYFLFLEKNWTNLWFLNERKKEKKKKENTLSLTFVIFWTWLIWSDIEIETFEQLGPVKPILQKQ